MVLKGAVSFRSENGAVHLYVTQSDFTREKARLPMVGDIFLIWDGLGVGGGGGGQLPKKLQHKEKAPKNIMQGNSRKRNREQINGKNCVAQKNCATPEVKGILF